MSERPQTVHTAALPRMAEANALILLLIVIVVVTVACAVAFRLGQRNPSAQDAVVDKGTQAVTLVAGPAAKRLGLQEATLVATQLPDFTVQITLPETATLPGGTVLEAWIYDEARGVRNTSVSGNDEIFGVPFNDNPADTAVDSAPFAKSLGVLRQNGKTFILPAIRVEGLRPYDQLLITLESDRNLGNYDPRPGTPLFVGAL